MEKFQSKDLNQSYIVFESLIKKFNCEHFTEKKKKKKNAAIDYGVFIKNFQFIKGFCYTVKIFIMHTHQEVTIVYLCLSTKQEL